MVLVGIAEPMGQHQRWIEFAVEGLEVVFDVGALKREIPVAEFQNLDLFFTDVREKGGRAGARLVPTRAGAAAEDDPAHDEIGYLGGETQDCSTAANLDVVGMGAQAEQLQRPQPIP